MELRACRRALLSGMRALGNARGHAICRWMYRDVLMIAFGNGRGEPRKSDEALRDARDEQDKRPAFPAESAAPPSMPEDSTRDSPRSLWEGWGGAQIPRRKPSPNTSPKGRERSSLATKTCARYFDRAACASLLRCSQMRERNAGIVGLLTVRGMYRVSEAP